MRPSPEAAMWLLISVWAEARQDAGSAGERMRGPKGGMAMMAVWGEGEDVSGVGF